MRNCRRCGEVLDDEHRYCWKCGYEYDRINSFDKEIIHLISTIVISTLAALAVVICVNLLSK